jgi:hypothetical protein
LGFQFFDGFFDNAGFEMLSAFGEVGFALFLRIAIRMICGGRALAEIRILWLTYGDALLDKGSRFGFEC